MREEDVPAEQPEAKEDPRLPAPDAHPRRPSGHRPSARQGSLQSLSLIWSVRDRAMFRAIAHGHRRRSGALQVSAAVLSTRQEPPRIAFAVGRPVGNAVVRNRVRRRLRAAVREQCDLLQPGWGYLVTAAPAAAAATYRELSDALHVILGAHSGEMS
jgi:ribonuclease P protein component